MEIEQLNDYELLSKANIKKLLQNTQGEEDELYFQYKNRCKELKITNNFNKRYKAELKIYINEKVSSYNFCEFEHDTFDKICTGDWLATEEGIFRQVPNYDTGEVDKVEASRIMMVPSEVMVNIDTQEEKVKLNYNKLNRWKSIIVDKYTISNANKIVELSKFGLDITSTNCKNVVDYFYDCLTLNDNESIKVYDSLSRMGWVEDEFMPYLGNMKFDGEQQNKYMYKALDQKGSFDDWIKTTKEMRGKSLILRLQMAEIGRAHV